MKDLWILTTFTIVALWSVVFVTTAKQGAVSDEVSMLHKDSPPSKRSK
jgi:hypothetical protein